jgi:hypothetical protein
MQWRCRFCGFEIMDREDRRKIKIKEDKVYVLGLCDNCLNWTILDSIPIDMVKKYLSKKIDN